MTMADFIEANREDILAEWDRFAATLEPAATGLDQKALRNFAKEMLATIAEDMRSTQSVQEESAKSRGLRPEDHPEVLDAATTHAAGRLVEGFTLPQMVSEYRALRASVIRRWKDQLDAPGRAEIDELTRFNEAMDESLSHAIQRYADRLEQARDLYVGALAHDLRNPLQAILTSADALAAVGGAGDPSAHLADAITRSGERMEKLVQDLLDFTRTRLGRGLPIELGPQDMAQLAREVAAEFQDGKAANPVQLDLPETLSGVWDGGRIQQLLSNLLGNARHHGAPGAPIQLQAQVQDGEVIVRVHNQGPGIPKEAQRHLFDPLTRALTHTNTRHRSGLGLGLYIARQIAESHGGTIELTASSEEQGTTFTVTLPRESMPEPPRTGMV